MGERLKLHFKGTRNYRKNNSKNSIKVIGIDTEADVKGRCFLISTSLGDSFSIEEFPDCLFNRKYMTSPHLFKFYQIRPGVNYGKRERRKSRGLSGL
jgi:hypothetical protein